MIKRYWWVLLILVVGVGLTYLYHLDSDYNKRRFGKIHAPYAETARLHQTQEEVIKKFGKPSEVMRNNTELAEFAHAYRTPLMTSKERKVLIYHRPTPDMSTICVYIGKDGRVTRTVLTGS